MFYQRIQKATHLSGKISQKYMLTSPGLEDQIPLIIYSMPSDSVITKPLDVVNEITIYSKNPKSIAQHPHIPSSKNA